MRLNVLHLYIHIHSFICHLMYCTKGKELIDQQNSLMRNHSIIHFSQFFPSCCHLYPSFPLSFDITGILKALDVAIGLQWRKENVEKPQADKQHGGQDLCSPGSAKLSTNLWSPSVHQSGNRDKGKYGKESDRESQSAWINFKVLPLAVVVDGSNGPGHLKTHQFIKYKLQWPLKTETYIKTKKLYCQSIVHLSTVDWAGLTPIPRKTLTALEPVTLPMDASAYWSWIAATLLANVSGWWERENIKFEQTSSAYHIYFYHFVSILINFMTKHILKKQTDFIHVLHQLNSLMNHTKGLK